MSKGSVEVFEVGQQQLWNMLCVDACVGDYVCVSTFGHFGYVNNDPICFVPQNQDLDSLLTSFGHLYELDIWALDEGLTSYADEYELWHVVDDDDLWQAWEHEAWIARMLDGGMYDKVYVLPSDTEDDACGFEGERTDWHVYDGRDCVMDLERVPQVLYKLETLDDCMSVLETKWYTDAMLFAGDMGFALAQGCKLWLGDVSPMPDAVTIVDDYDCMLDDYGDGSVLEVTLLAATA